MYLAIAIVMMILTLPVGTHALINGGGMNWFFGVGVYFLIYTVHSICNRKKTTPN